MVAQATSGGGGYKVAKPKPKPKRAAPARSNKGGATRGRERAAQVRQSGKAKAVRAAVKGPKRVAKARPKPTSQAAASVGINAYRDYANSMTNLAKTGVRPASGAGFSIPNPFDVLGQGLGNLGGVIRDAFGNVVPQDILIRESAERIRDATRR